MDFSNAYQPSYWRVSGGQATAPRGSRRILLRSPIVFICRDRGDVVLHSKSEFRASGFFTQGSRNWEWDGELAGKRSSRYVGRQYDHCVAIYPVSLVAVSERRETNP